MSPHCPTWQATGVHAGAPHWLGMPPPPQVCPFGQFPQSREPPQPSPAGPQPMPWSIQVCFTHAGGPEVDTHDARSKSMYARTFSCEVSGLLSHSAGKTLSLVLLPVVTWKSLKRTRPHWFATG